MSSAEKKETINRLCSEIQLFDLCELDSCSARIDRFCTDKELLARFEAIKEEDDRPPLVYDEEELDDDLDGMDDYEEFEAEGSDDE